MTAQGSSVSIAAKRRNVRLRGCEATQSITKLDSFVSVAASFLRRVIFVKEESLKTQK